MNLIYRMPIKETRALIHGILDGTLHSVEWEVEPYFDLSIPKSCPGVSTEVLNPINTWKDKEEYKKTAERLRSMFQENFENLKDNAPEEVRKAAL